jgi:NTE family protein
MHSGHLHPDSRTSGRWLVDGGLVANLPVNFTRELGADVVIAVDVNLDGVQFFEDPRTALGVLAHVFVAVERIVSNQERADADFVITPKVGHIRWDQTRRADELIKAGYDAAVEVMNEIKAIVGQTEAVNLTSPAADLVRG